MNISFKDFIAISEGKQVGTIYHFTRLGNLANMLDNNFDMTSNRGYVSFTRDYNLLSQKKNNMLAKNLTSWGPFDIGIARIAIDGDKLSNRYKIEPYMDRANGVDHKTSEQEERIENRADITNYIKQIDIVLYPEFKTQIENLKNELFKTKLYNKYKFNYLTDLDKLKKVK